MNFRIREGRILCEFFGEEVSTMSKLPWLNSPSTQFEQNHIPNWFAYIPAKNSPLYPLNIRYLVDTLKPQAILNIKPNKKGNTPALDELDVLNMAAHKHDLKTAIDDKEDE